MASGEIITTTDNHPFWTIDTKSWTEADELTNRSVLLDINDTNATIKSLKSYGESRRVYNLTVGNLHTYYVGFSGVLGHNCNLNEKYEDLLSEMGGFTLSKEGDSAFMTVLYADNFKNLNKLKARLKAEEGVSILNMNSGVSVTEELRNVLERKLSQGRKYLNGEVIRMGPKGSYNKFLIKFDNL